MLIFHILEFYWNLPPKLCVSCGSVIDEQSECYSNICHSCLGLKDI